MKKIKQKLEFIGFAPIFFIRFLRSNQYYDRADKCLYYAHVRCQIQYKILSYYFEYYF